MVCFPHAGGFSLYYSFMKDAKYQNITEVCLFDYNRPRSGDKRACFEDFVKDAAEYVLKQQVSAGDYILFGHSMGAFVACECGLLLQEQGIPPAGVIVSGQNPPFYYREKSWELPKDTDAYLQKLGGIPDFIKDSDTAYSFFKQMICDDMHVLETYRPSFPTEDERLPLGMNMVGDSDMVIIPEAEPLWHNTFHEIYRTQRFSGGHFYFDGHYQEITDLIDEFAGYAERNKKYVYRIQKCSEKIR
ncbi:MULTISPECIES: alpha/beta fold hydrolase [unclassified Ruminococcus]|uniref:thioesterase II family protein n=1 Tax=unclassified Ruminococcus TaxID=2608920 RepID=UPI001585DEC4|nr:MULTISPECIES: alpha/beta fold hydrolase [unclassified Ruminococcus]